MSSRRGLAIAAGVSAIAAGALLAAPKIAAARIRNRADDPDPLLEPVINQTLCVPTHDGGSIHVVRAGAGPPIVLSHGVTLSVRTWVKQLRALPAAGFEVIAFDHRGHGRSEVGDAGHDRENLGHDVHAVLEGLDLHDVVLVGHSMGGVAVESFAIRHPAALAERVSGIVLLSTLARAPAGSQATRFKNLIERVTNRAPDSTPIWRSRDVGLLLARLGFGRDPRPSHVELVRKMMLECPPATRVEAPRALAGLDLVDELSSIKVPVLVVCGTNDVITPLGHSRQIAKHIPDARLEVLDGGGHMLMLEREDELNRLVIEFAHEVQG